MPTNYMECIVDNLLPSVLTRFELICTCDKCIEDIKAITLNNLRPLYIVTQEGNVYAKLNEFDTQINSDVIKQLTLAIIIVSTNPHH